MNLQKLQASIQGRIVTDEEALTDVSTDFGRLTQYLPRALAVPSGPDDVRRIVEAANEESWTLAVRGAGHSQSGQSLSQGGMVLDTSGLSHIGPVEGESVWVGAGVIWGDLVDFLMPRGLVPPVLTNNLNVTVGGTLSMAGLGVASHRFGTQTDNVEALEVVTGAGDLVTCSREENRALFDAVRCGLGQFGIITKAKLKVRRYSPNVRTFYLLYDNLESLMRDQTRILGDQRFDFIEGWAAPCVQGLRSLGGMRVPFAEWFYPVQVSVEYADSAPSESLLADLEFYRNVYLEDSSLITFFKRMEPVFQLWRESGSWNLPHPWMEVILPWDRAGQYIQGVLKSFPPNLLLGGHVLLWPCRGTVSEAPMFVHPPGEFVMGFGILPAVPRHLLRMALSLLEKASDLSMQVGGKRYLSGWIDFDRERWKAHYGAAWTTVLEWKRFFDPNEVLSPGFIRYKEGV